MSTTPSIAIFGATGPTGTAVLKNVLAFSPNAHVNLLCRTPSNIASQYPPATYPNLHIIEGGIHDLPAIKTALIDPATQSPVAIIVSAIGMTLVKSSFMSYKFSDKTLCQEGIKNILNLLEDLEKEGHSTSEVRLVALSSTGISSKGRDIPLQMVPLYYGLLGTPHDDKKKMEEEIVEGKGKGRRWVIVRPSWFVDENKNRKSVRVGWEIPGKGNSEDHLEIGFTITREDVGKWIFENVIKDPKDGEKWEGRLVSLTH